MVHKEGKMVEIVFTPNEMILAMSYDYIYCRILYKEYDNKPFIDGRDPFHCHDELSSDIFS